MKPQIKRVAGVGLVVIACTWIAVAQMLIWTVPSASASSLPERIYPSQESFTRKNIYELTFAMAREINGEIPNVLFPAALLLLGSWLFCSSRESARVK